MRPRLNWFALAVCVYSWLVAGWLVSASRYVSGAGQ